MAVIEDPANKDPENGDPSGTPGGSTGGGGTPKTPAPPIAPPPSPTAGHHPATAPFVPTSGHKATITDPPVPKGRGVRPGAPLPNAPVIPPPPTGGPPPTDTVPTTVTVDLPSRTSVFKPTPDNPLLPLYGPFGKVGAQLVYDKVQIDGSCVSAWVISYRCSSLTNIMVDGALITTFTGQYEIHLGDPSTDPAHAILHAAEPTIVSAIWQPAVAMVVARFPPITAQNPKAPDTTRFQCDGVGMPLRDHRQDASLVTRFSNIAGNFALQTADFLADPNFGANRPLTEVFGNTTLLDEAADDCDHIIDGGTTKRYSGGMQLQPQYVDQQINFMRAHFAGNVSFNNGVFNIWVEKARSAVAMSLTSEGASANILSAGPWEYPGRKQTTTRYRINFVNVDAGFKDDTVASDDPLLASNGVVFVETVLTCGFITKDIATRLANQYRKDLSLGQGTWVRLNAEWLQLLPGVRLPLTSDQLNTSAADMRVTDVRSSSQDAFPTMGEVYVKPYSAAIYDDTKVTATATVPPLNPTPWSTPPDVTGADGQIGRLQRAGIWFTQPANYPYVKHYNIYNTYGGIQQLSYQIAARDIPTSADPFDVDALSVRSDPQNFPQRGFSAAMQVLVTVVSQHGEKESAGVAITKAAAASATGGIDPFVNQGEASMPLVNGANVDISAVAVGPPMHVITGPTAAFSIGGFLGGGFPVAGMLLRVRYTGSQSCTILNEDPSSTATGRIKTGTGANVSASGPFDAWFSYNSTEARVTLDLFYDGTIAVVGGSVGIGTNAPSGTLHVAGSAFPLLWQRIVATASKLWGFQTDSAGTYLENVTDSAIALAILNGGKIGIGTTSPAVLLEIAGSAGSEAFRLTGLPKFAGTNSIGTGGASLSSNCPAADVTTPYTWVKCISSDGSTVYIPAWK